MIESFVAKNWRTLLLVGIILFAWLVWPTAYKPLPPTGTLDAPGIILRRENRFTGTVQFYFEGEWK